MLARRRLRQRQKRLDKEIASKSPDSLAKEIVLEEIADWKERIRLAREEKLTKRTHYEQQEAELRQQHEDSKKSLDQRRSTLLATTSLIPYTKIIQSASNFHVPAALLTFQARLCLHVHCLCVHEELLLRTKEQGWDTIAWMEDVSRQLRLLTTQQMILWQGKLKEEVNTMKKYQEFVQIPLDVLEILEQDFSEEDRKIVEASSGDGGDGDDSPVPILLPDGMKTPSSKEMMEQPAYQPPGKATSPSNNKDESFMQFLQKYEQRKEHQQRSDQMRLAEFRGRGTTNKSAAYRFGGRRRRKEGETSTAPDNNDTNDVTTRGKQNPYTSKRAAVGKKLKGYATKLFQGNDESISQLDLEGDGDGDGDESTTNSLTINSSHHNHNGSASSLGVTATTTTSSNTNDSNTNTTTDTNDGLIRPRKWAQAVKRRSTSILTTIGSQSESNLDVEGNSWSLGSSLRGLRSRGLGRGRNRNSTNDTPTTDMTTQAELSHDEESSSSSDSSSEEEGKQEVTDSAKDNNANDNDIAKDSGGPGDMDESIHLAGTANGNQPGSESGDGDTSPAQYQMQHPPTKPVTPLKSKLQAPVISGKFHESARW